MAPLAPPDETAPLPPDNHLNDDARPVWEQKTDERALYFARFQHFLHLGPKRSMLGAYNADRKARGEKAGKSVPSSWDKVASEWAWAERAAAFDEEQLRLEREAFERAQDALWEKRRRDTRERLFHLNEKILAKVEAMAEFPLVTTTVEERYEDGRPKIINVHAARWGFSTMGTLSKNADVVLRLAFDLERAGLKRQFEQLSDDEIIHATTALLDDLAGASQSDAAETNAP